MNSYTIKSTDLKDQFLRFANSDGKRWVVPTRNMSIALNLYQPSGAKGKLVKMLLPYLYWLPLVRSAIKAEKLQIKLDNSIKQLLCDILGVDSFEFSIFEGTPSVHKKVTIQLSQEDKILAYCKLSENDCIISLFRKEAKTLAILHSKGVDNIPIPLYCGDIDNTTIFIQSTIKTPKSKVVHQWQDEHWEFLETLHNKTKEKLQFGESDFAKSLNRLEGQLSNIPERNIVAQTIERVREYYGDGEVEFSAYHADFTPWNMFFDREQLFVFDFEYAEMTYPPYLDWFHYFTQCANFEKHLSPMEIVAEFNSSKMHDNNIAYKSYLLDVISRYIHRESGNISCDTMNSIRFWIEILRLL